MPVISAVSALFRPDDAPWTLTEISQRLECIESNMNYDRVHRAWSNLLRVSELSVLVQPLSKKLPLRFGVQATRLIARQALSRRTKKLIVESARTGTSRPTGAPIPSNSASNTSVSNAPKSKNKS